MYAMSVVEIHQKFIMDENFNVHDVKFCKH